MRIHPVVPALLLVLVGVHRIFTDSWTWYSIIGLVAGGFWFAEARKNWRARRDAAEAAAAPLPRTPEETQELRGHIAEIRRMQREWSAPPPRVPTEDEIRATAQPAIFAHRATFPVPLDHPARSYLGGLPRLPAELSWPEVEKYERIGLHFLAQIDLAELPAIEGSPLPRSGTLFFFADMNDEAPEPADCRVLYYAGGTADVPVRELPPNVPSFGDIGGSGAWFPASSPWSRMAFRFPLEFAVFDSVRDYLIVDGATMPPPRNRDGFDRLMREEFTRRFGAREAPPADGWRVLAKDGDEWPFAWAAVDTAARALAQAISKAAGQREAAEAAAELQRLAESVSKWVDRAACETLHARCDEATRAAFLVEWRSLAAEYHALRKRLKIYGSSPDRDVADFVKAASYICAIHGALDVIPEHYRNALEHVNDIGVNFPRHQLLGHGENVQWAPIEHAQQVLLLQVMGEGGLGWHFPGGCALQFWIGAKALRERAFESVEMTLECD